MGIHISDLTSLYIHILSKVLDGTGDSIPNGKKGYYFAVAHYYQWWNASKHLAKALYEKGVVESEKVEEWPGDSVAKEAYGVPEFFVGAIRSAA